MKKFTVLLLLYVLAGCYDEKSEDNHLFTTKVCDNLYVEIFSVYKGGVQGGDVNSDYLTDSISFRLFVGTYDDNRNFYYHCHGDSVVIEEISRRSPDYVFSKRTYSIKQLQKEKKFE
jgi:hypothetical protein